MTRSPPLVTFIDVQLIQVVNLLKPLDTIKIELWTITCADVQFRMQRPVVELEHRYST
jgi:hypothetical protein